MWRSTSVDLYYSADGGATYTLVVAGLANTGSYVWTLPSTATVLGRIRVVARDAAGNTGSDVSNSNFTIATASSTPVATDGFETGTLTGGSGWSDSAWSSSGHVGVVTEENPAGRYDARLRVTGRIERSVDLSGLSTPHLKFLAKAVSVAGADAARVLVSVDGGATWVTLKTITAAQSRAGYLSYDLDLSAYAGKRIRIAFAATFDYWAASLYIDSVEVTGSGTSTPTDTTSPVVTVASPNGGQTLTAAGTTTITWTATDNVAVSSVDLYYSADGGATYTLIVAGLANTGSYVWTLPSTATVLGRIRVVALTRRGTRARMFRTATSRLRRPLRRRWQPMDLRRERSRVGAAGPTLRGRARVMWAW